LFKFVRSSVLPGVALAQYMMYNLNENCLSACLQNYIGSINDDIHNFSSWHI